MTIRKVVSKLLYVFACVFLCVVVVGICLYTRFPKGSVETTGTIVDNDYNNYLSGGDLVRIDDKLYYNYFRNDFAYGLVEISQEGSKRIHWEGWKFGGYRVLHKVRQHDGQVVMAYYDEIRAYSPETDTFETYDPLNTIPLMTLAYQSVGQKCVYRQAKDPQDKGIKQSGNLCVYEQTGESVITGPYANSFYAVGDEIYYYDFNDNLRTNELRKYNLTDGTDVFVYNLEDYLNKSAFMIEGNYLIFEAGVQNPDNYKTSVYKMDLNSFLPKIEVVCTEDAVGAIHSFNVYDGKIYVASDTGITTFDVTTNESAKLYDGNAWVCYIVDDTWVYFKGAGLWRIPQIGGMAEKVFG